MVIRDEAAADQAAVQSVIAAAFAGHPYSNQQEGALVDALRAAEALTLSLVAEEEGVVVGHIAFSAVAIGGASLGWRGLGPLAVRPDRQRRGIGAALIETGLSRLRESGAAGCVVFGEPAYYGRFGFRAMAGLRFPGAPPELFMALPFGPAVPDGEVSYHPLFSLVG